MSSYLPFQRFHRREEENVADGRAVGEEHDETVDADADAARWGKAILKSNDIILVHDVRFGVPRFVWNMPYFFMGEGWKAKVIAAAGFVAELFAAVVLLAAWHEFGRWYAGVAVAHLVAYRWYAGEASDFKWFGRG